MGSNNLRLMSDAEYAALDEEGHELLGLVVRKARAERSLTAIDRMSPELRACVHEHGIGIVQSFLAHGVKSVRSINYLVAVVRGIQPETGGVGNRGNAPKGKNKRAAEEYHDAKTLGLPPRYLMPVPKSSR